MNVDWKKAFDSFGIKKVTKTDKGKSAYVPNWQQRAAIEKAGITPAKTRPAPGFDIIVLFETRKNIVQASYYYSERSDEANRLPEPRMGHEFISSWLEEGDNVLIGSVGNQIFAVKMGGFSASGDEIAIETARRASRQNVLKRAKAAKGKPLKRTVQRDDFVRDAYVVAGAILRSGGKCEMPGCGRGLFLKDDDTPYLEVHHVTPLAEGGDDTLVNAAALCPHCHRALHFGKDRMAKRGVLAKHIAVKPV